MILLSIDPGYEKVGYAVFDLPEDNSGNVIFKGSALIKTSKSLEHETRLLQIHKTLQEVIAKNHVKRLVIESLFYFKNKKTVIKVAQAYGVIELLAGENGIPITRLSPLQIKQIITGYGQADKQSVEKMIRLELGEKIKIKDDDESDAIACGLAYCFINKSTNIV